MTHTIKRIALFILVALSIAIFTGVPALNAKGRQMPDLIVKDIRLTDGCLILVTIKNIGNVGVPDTFYRLPKAVGVQMYRNGKPWGGLILDGFDPKRKLKSPGGEASHVWFPGADNLKITPGVHSLKVVVDNRNVLPEKNERNNSLTRRVKCKAAMTVPPRNDHRIAHTPVMMAKEPQRIFLDFRDAYITFQKSTQSIQVIAESNVLSYANDWEKCPMKPYLFHIKQRNWRGFYWKVNTSRKEVYQVTGGEFCSLGGKEEKLDVVVQDNDKYFYLRFPSAHLVYEPGSRTIQVTALGVVLSYGQDWETCNLLKHVYQLKLSTWSNFYWEINTLKKKVARVEDNPFCKPGGKKKPLKASVRVVY